MTEKNYFTELNEIDVSSKVERKNNLSYLSWAWAWGEVKKKHPEANYIIYERPDGINYWDDGNTAWVKTGVIIKGIEHIEYLPIMDFRNKSIEVSELTSFDVNKAIQRSLTKAIARHGLGLYIYAGEDLPEAVMEEKKHDAAKANEAQALITSKMQELVTFLGSKDEAMSYIGMSVTDFNRRYTKEPILLLNDIEKAVKNVK